MSTQETTTYEIYTSGRFQVEQSNESAFVEAWSEFAAWVSQRPGAGTLRLFRDVRNAGRFVALGEWDDADAVREWKSSAEFKERMGRMVREATEFEPTEYVTMAKATEGAVESLSPPEGLEAIHAPS
jgi:heme-degrading monooxygenase HmoA